VNKAINLSGKVKKMATIDTETYRERRETSLISLAQKLAEKAKRIQRPITLNHMNAHNRRIIHLTLKNDAEVTTKSRGEGEFRKIVIIPVKKDA
jgi:spoIIIJ-associated protein